MKKRRKWKSYLRKFPRGVWELKGIGSRKDFVENESALGVWVHFLHFFPIFHEGGGDAAVIFRFLIRTGQDSNLLAFWGFYDLWIRGLERRKTFPRILNPVRWKLISPFFSAWDEEQLFPSTTTAASEGSLSEGKGGNYQKSNQWDLELWERRILARRQGRSNSHWVSTRWFLWLHLPSWLRSLVVWNNQFWLKFWG